MADASQLYIITSLATDCSLSLILLGIWLRQRREQHVLFWAISQLGAGLNIYVQFVAAWGPWSPLLAAVGLSVSLWCMWLGSWNLARKPSSPRDLMLYAACAGLTVLGLLAYWRLYSATARVQESTALLLALMMLFSGIHLLRCSRLFWLLGAVLCLRGSFNLFNAFGLIGLDYLSWAMFAVSVKTVWILGLVSAIQSKLARQHSNTMNSLDCGIAIVNLDGHILQANAAFRQMLSRPFAGGSRPELLPLVQGPARSVLGDYLHMVAHLESAPVLRRSSFLQKPDGAMMPVDIVASNYTEAQQRYLAIQLLDVSERFEQEQDLAWAASHDRQTSLPNRFWLAQKVFDRQSSNADVLAYVVLDVDRFQRVNDLFGYQLGDQLLQNLAQRIREHIPQDVLIVRLDGDQFVLLVVGTSIEQVRESASRYAAQVQQVLQTNFKLDSHSLVISACLGVACYPADSPTPEGALRNAEIAMYQAKRQGRGQCCVFHHGMVSKTGAALLIDTALRSAIELQQLHLVYQPIVTTATRELRKVEALLRWHHPTLGNVGPDRFIPVAEESDLIQALGAWVIGAACQQLAAWGAQANDLVMSINVSPQQLAAPNFVALVDELTSRYGVRPQQIELEITERVLLDDGRSARAVMDQLRQRGVRFALDDFGTGYSAMSYLTSFQFETLKIDRSFISNIDQCEKMRGLAAAMVSMGAHLGMELVAEGVETEAQFATLREIGCQQVQGYLISRPVSAEHIFSASTIPR